MDLVHKGVKLPTPGETVVADTFIQSPGGKGSNQAISAAKLGADIRFIACVGDDTYGEKALSVYRMAGIPEDTITVCEGCHSGAALIMVDNAGVNYISVSLGANLKLTREHIDKFEDTMKQSFIFGTQLENDHDTVFYALDRAHALGITTFLDPSPAYAIPADLCECVDIIKPNAIEAETISGIAVTDIHSAETAGKWFVEKGIGTAIITLGEQGCVLVTKNRHEHYPAPHVKAVDTTGAGDVFSAGILSGLSEGRSHAETLAFASHAAALSATRLGVIDSIPSRDEVYEFMNNNAE
jgi:ribokinase